MSNHDPNQDPEMTAYLNARLREALEPHRPGPTGRHPHGKLTPTDEGEIKILVGVRDGKVVIDFGKPTAWIGFTPELARSLAESLIDKAETLEKGAVKP